MSCKWFQVTYFIKTHARLLETFFCTESVTFAGLEVVLLGDFLLFPPVRGK